MPAKSKAQQQLMALAEHAPSKLFARDKGVAKMSHQQLHDFAATKAKGLPAPVKAAPKFKAAPVKMKRMK